MVKFKFSPDGSVGFRESTGASVRWYGLFDYLEPSSSWMVLNRLGFDFGYKIYDQLSLHAESKIFNEATHSIGWYIKAPLTTALSGWKLFILDNLQSAWDIHRGSVRFRNAPDGFTAWYELPKSVIRWSGLNRYTQQKFASRILVQEQSSLSWMVKNSFINFLSWRLFNKSENTISWYIKTENNRSSGWRIFTGFEQDSSWRIQHGLEQTGGWRIFNQHPILGKWYILAGVGFLSGWICYGLVDGPVFFARCYPENFLQYAKPLEADSLDAFVLDRTEFHHYLNNGVCYNKIINVGINQDIKIIPSGFQFFSERKR